MICGKCGREFAAGVKFCTNCGVELIEQEATETVEGIAEDVEETVEKVAEAAEDAVETVEEAAGAEEETSETGTDATEQSGEVVDAETTEVAVTSGEEKEVLEGEVVTGELADKKKEKKISLKVKIGAAVAAVLVLVLLLVVLLSGKKEFGTYSDKSVMDFYSRGERMYAYLYNGTELLLDDTEVSVEDASLDKTTICYSNENDELVILKNGKTIKTGIEEAKGVKVSSEGDTFVYFTDCENSILPSQETGTLHLYFIKKGKDIKVAEDVLVSSAVLSPNGETVAYVSDYESFTDFKGYYSIKGKKPVDVGKEKRVFALADKAKYIYYTDDDRIYVQKKKDVSEKLAKELYTTTVMLNADCSEMVFVDEGATYITLEAGERKKIYNNELNAIMLRYDETVRSDVIRSAKGAIFVTYTGADTFKNQLLYGSFREDIVYVKENFETERLASDADKFGIADDEKSLVYVDGSDIVKVTEFAKGGLKSDLKEDADAHDLYAAGALKYVYYVNRDKELFCIKGNGKAKKIADDVTSATISADGKYCYYVVDEEKLCYSKKGGKGKELLEQEEIEITCRNDFGGIAVAAVERIGMTTVYRLEGKEMKLVTSVSTNILEDAMGGTIDFEELFDGILN